jgi:hypothetical protein
MIVKNKAILRIIATTFKSELFIGIIPLSISAHNNRHITQ